VANESGNIDPALSLLVNIVNGATKRQDGGADITLTVNGLTVSGKITPAWQWLEDVEQQSTLAGDDRWATFFRDGMDGIIDKQAEWKAVQPVIHLRDARFFPLGGLTPVPAMEKRGFHWRGKIADVSGWMPGVLTVDGDADDENAA
jgi:hypothetical protein